MITLGGMSVCDGHSAVLTRLEATFGLRRSFSDLLARALACADGKHADWWEAAAVLAERSDMEAWDATPALRSDTDPLRRRFAADLVWYFLIVDRPAPSGRALGSGGPSTSSCRGSPRRPTRRCSRRS